MSVEIKGIDKLIVKLEKLSDVDLKPALNKACIVVENDARTNCPVDTGALKRSITHEVEDETGVIGTNMEYASYVEFGTGIHAVKGDGRTTAWHYKTADGEWHTTRGQNAQPFLQPALESNKDTIIKILKEAVKDAGR